jgi:YgiT-type zinc finger domain-containing protein
MEEMNCHICGKNTKISVGNYHYRESGLDNVWLEDVEILQCDCGESALIPRAPEVHSLIANCLIRQNGQLSGKEIRFLRKNMWVKLADFAPMIEVDPIDLARWERGEGYPDPRIDKRIRFVYAIWMGLKDLSIQIAKDIFKGIEPSQGGSPIYIAVTQLRQISCSINN